MPYPDVLQWSSFHIDIRIVELIQNVESFDHMSKYRMFSVKVLDIIGKRDEELRSTTALVRGSGRRDGHRYSSTRGMLQRSLDFWCDISRRCRASSLL
jgi:hypothetical protein